VTPAAVRPPRPARGSRIALPALLALALLLRWLAQADFQAAPDDVAPLIDSEAYLLQAVSVAEGGDIAEGVYFQAPLYPWILGLTLRMTGVVDERVGPVAERAAELPPDVLAGALRVGRALNVCFGLLLVVLVWRLGQQLFGEGAGLAAGLLAACYGPFLYQEAHLFKDSLSLLFIPWAVLAAAAAQRQGTRGGWFWCGLALGLGGLVRGNLHLLSLLAAAALVGHGWARRSLPSGLGRAACLLLGAGLALAPVVLRNSLVAGRPVLSTAAGGTAFWLCNHAGNDTGLVEHTDLNRQVPSHELDDWMARTAALVGHPVTPEDVSRYWRDAALADIAADPVRWLRLELRKLFLLCSRYEAPDHASASLAEPLSPLLWANPVRYGLVFPLGFAGLLLLWERRRQHDARPGRAALLLALGGYAGSLLLFNVSSRFRMPLTVPWLVLAGYLLSELRTLAAPETRGAVRWKVAAALLLGLVLSHVSEGPLGPLDAVELAAHRATRLQNAAQAALDRGDAATARADLQAGLDAARAVSRSAPGLLVRLAELDRAEALALEAGGDAAAAAALRAAAVTGVQAAFEADPGHAGAQRLAGLLLYDEAAFADAVPRLKSTLEASPADREARQYLALCLLYTGRAREALDQAEVLIAQRREDDDGHGLAAAAAAALGARELAQEHLAEYDRLVADSRAVGRLPRLPELGVFASLRAPSTPATAVSPASPASQDPAASARPTSASAGAEAGTAGAGTAASSGAPAGPAGDTGAAPTSLFEAVASPFAAVVCGREDVDTILEVNGGGLALFDADGDADLDVLLVSPGPWPAPGVARGGSNRLYRNDGDWTFVEVTAGSGVDVAAFCNGVAIGDIDADGRRDVYLTCWGPNVMLRNLGGLRFEPLPAAAGAAGGPQDGLPEWSTSAVFVDLDRDGDLDLYVANYLGFDSAHPPLHGQEGRSCTWKGMPVMCGPQGLPVQADRYFRNEGGRFDDATAEAGFDVAPGYGLGVLDGDFDSDGWPDLYVANDSTPNFLFMGRGDGMVEERGMTSGAALSAAGREQASMGIAAGDLDGRPGEEIMVTNFSMEPNALYRNLGDAVFRDDADPSGLGGPSRPLLGWGVAFLDVDLDGDQDVVAANGHVYRQADAPGTDTSYAQPTRLWLNDGTGRFSVAAWPGDTPRVGRALAAGDLDDDGVLDVVALQRAGVPAVWRGLGGGGRALQVVLAGPPGNPDGLGAVVSFRDAQGTRTQRVRNGGGYQSVRDPRPVFGWRGPGQLVVTTPDGRSLEQQVDQPGRVQLSWGPP